MNRSSFIISEEKKRKEMKIQCDVCSAERASVFCCADEAALCGPCDKRVHSANKLAGKHRRFSLLNPNSNSSSNSSTPPLCDICQEKKGFLFCQEDRAVLCRDCDVPIHNANAHTMKHSRFLLTGVSLSSLPITTISRDDVDGDTSSNSDHNHNVNVIINDQLHGHQTETKQKLQEDEEVLCAATSSRHSSSSISEYLIKLLPGWHVEDVLFDDATTNAALATIISTEDEFPFLERSSSSNGELGSPIWVPTPEHVSDQRNVSHESSIQVKSSQHKRCNSEVFMVLEFHSKRHRINSSFCSPKFGVCTNFTQPSL